MLFNTVLILVLAAIFATANYLKGHTNNVHKGLKLYKCETCDNTFNNRASLNRHISTVHKGERNHKCELCSRRFSDKRSLKKHVSNVHEGQNTAEC